MIVDVYDTYASSANGTTIHFDVLVPANTDAKISFQFALEWLRRVGLEDADLKQSRCRFCHSENADDEVVSDIRRDGYHIIRMEGCPSGG